MASVKVILREDKKDVNGQSPLYLRVIKDRKTKFISLRVKISGQDWNDTEMKVRKSHVNYQQMNSYISKKKADAEGIALDVMTKNKEVTSKRLKEEIIGKKPVNFFDFSYYKLERMRKTLKPSSYKSYYYFLQKFEKYAGSRDLYFDEITAAFLKGYEYNTVNECQNSMRTAAYAAKTIKLFFNLAIAEEAIPLDVYPFHKYKIKIPKSNRQYLNEEQFEKVKSIDLQNRQKASLYRDMYIFACYAGGLRFFDVADLKWENYIVSEQRIVKIIRKSGRLHQFKLPSTAIEILNQYKKDNAEPTDHVFPCLRNDFDYAKDIEQLYNDKDRYLQYSVKYLKSIGKQLGFPFSLTFHTSRHTFATRALNKGMRIEHVSKIMDHSNIQITQVYAKIISEELDKAMEVLEC